MGNQQTTHFCWGRLYIFGVHDMYQIEKSTVKNKISIFELLIKYWNKGCKRYKNNWEIKTLFNHNTFPMGTF